MFVIWCGLIKKHFPQAETGLYEHVRSHYSGSLVIAEMYCLSFAPLWLARPPHTINDQNSAMWRKITPTEQKLIFYCPLNSFNNNNLIIIRMMFVMPNALLCCIELYCSSFWLLCICYNNTMGNVLQLTVCALFVLVRKNVQIQHIAV